MKIKECKVLLRNGNCFVVDWDGKTHIQFPAMYDTGADNVYVKNDNGYYSITEKPKKAKKKMQDRSLKEGLREES